MKSFSYLCSPDNLCAASASCLFVHLFDWPVMWQQCISLIHGQELSGLHIKHQNEETVRSLIEAHVLVPDLFEYFRNCWYVILTSVYFIQNSLEKQKSIHYSAGLWAIHLDERAQKRMARLVWSARKSIETKKTNKQKNTFYNRGEQKSISDWTSNHEADWLQQQKSTYGSTPLSQNRNLRRKLTKTRELKIEKSLTD